LTRHGARQFFVANLQLGGYRFGEIADLLAAVRLQLRWRGGEMGMCVDDHRKPPKSSKHKCCQFKSFKTFKRLAQFKTLSSSAALTHRVLPSELQDFKIQTALIVSSKPLCYSSLLQSVQSFAPRPLLIFNDLNGWNILNVLNDP
jgi:hypothetical protein